MPRFNQPNHHCIMKSIYILLLATFTVACNSNKEVIKADREPVHRYSVVYEGNKIIRYDKAEKPEQLEEDLAMVETKTAEEQEQQTANASELPMAKSKLPLQQILKTATRKPRRHAEIKSEPDKSVGANEDYYRRGGGLGWGKVGFIMFITGVICILPKLIIGGEASLALAVIGLVLILLSFISGLIGVIKNDDTLDFWLGFSALGGSILLFILL